ncbi:MAG TPA: hypothetical protein DCR21_03755 [Succinivibrionaceae bacterium]|nr:hypothetical protein [Succinivibrionaceae bacterium]
MTEIIAVANPKGGSAKTSTAVNLSCALAATMKRVMLVDLDPQCSATVAMGFERSVNAEHSLAGVMISGNDPRECIRRCVHGNFDLLAANEDLTAVPVAMYNEPDGRIRLRKVLSPLFPEYDYIFIDCPPAANNLTENALCCANRLLIPMPCEYFAIDSMISIITMYERLNKAGDANIKLLGVVRTLYDDNQPLSAEISSELKKQFGEMLFESIIPYNLRISESSSTGRPVMLYDRSSQGARAYLALAGELLTKLKS